MYLCPPDRSAPPSPSAGLDQAVGQLLIDTLTRPAVEAALAVTAELQQGGPEGAVRPADSAARRH